MLWFQIPVFSLYYSPPYFIENVKFLESIRKLTYVCEPFFPMHYRKEYCRFIV